MSRVAPVLGLRPLRAARVRDSNVPKLGPPKTRRESRVSEGAHSRLPAPRRRARLRLGHPGCVAVRALGTRRDGQRPPGAAPVAP